jgi:hypothetical protein
MNKAIIERNLPHNDNYKIISYAYVSLIDGNGTCCDNCGKLISNMVTIENQNGVQYIVGNDCANTLTFEKWKLVFEIEPAFDEGKSLRAKIIKGFKSNKFNQAYLYKTNRIILEYTDGGNSMKKINYPEITIPYIKDLLTKK